jgi:hypothetical protein
LTGELTVRVVYTVNHTNSFNSISRIHLILRWRRERGVANYQSDPDSFTYPSHVDIGGLHKGHDMETGDEDEEIDNGSIARLPDQVESEYHGLRDLLDVRSAGTIASFYGSSIPNASFSGSTRSLGICGEFVEYRRGSCYAAARDDVSVRVRVVA